MHYNILAIGKPSLTFAQEGIREYEKRLSRYAKLSLNFLKKGEQMDESHRLIDSSHKTYRIVVDERGDRLTTAQLRQKFDFFEQSGQAKLSFLVGGAEGHSSELRQRADWILSLSSMTLQHEIAMLILLEQLYRLETIKAGSPYHRE
ncbi:MAG: 23S rRNA (pseudouridine(1915)-N(3))-methyltransferase RlmH [Verrucomicrobiota bacterium]